MANGSATDRRPVIAWPCANEASDANVSALGAKLSEAGTRIRLAEVVNPFGRALAERLDLNDALRRDPDAAVLDRFVDETRKDISSAIDAGADGILYRLHGACPQHCSPMQYGGYYLERDRELLGDAERAPLNVLFVVGGEGAYLDFVSDLPAQIFAWDAPATGVGSSEVRAMRRGAQASADDASEVFLDHSGLRIADVLENVIAEPV